LRRGLSANRLACESIQSAGVDTATCNGTGPVAWASRKAHGMQRTLRAFRRTRRSAVAMEMAMVALPFCLMLLGTFEVTFDLYVQSAMNLAVSQAARNVWIGAVQGPMTSASFVTQAVCPTLGSLLSCTGVIANVHPISQTSDFWNTPPPPYTDGSNLTVGTWTVCTGGPGQFVLVQLVYAGPTFVGLFIPTFTLNYSGVPVHPTYTSAAFVNQPFTATSTCSA
jgi:Flp pilus assembly protein TadG